MSIERRELLVGPFPTFEIRMIVRGVRLSSSDWTTLEVSNILLVFRQRLYGHSSLD